MADQPGSRPIWRPMARCRDCAAWWSVAPDSVTYVDDNPAFTTAKCPCGGELRIVAMEKHLESVALAPESQCTVPECGKRWRFNLDGLTTCPCGGRLELVATTS